MASTYSPALRLELMATGDQSGTWGDTTNTNLGTLLEQAITGYLSVAQGDVANLTLTTVNGGSDQARNAVVRITGALTATRNVVVQTANKLYTIANDTTGGFSIVVKTSAGTGVSVPPGAMVNVYSDGTNVVQGANYWSGQIGGQVYLDAGATVGPVHDLFRDSTSPAASDIMGQVVFNGRDSAANKQEYASIQAVIIDPTSTSEDGSLDLYATVAGTRTLLASVLGTGLGVANGTVSLPSLSFISDPDSGMYRIGANNLGIAVNGTKIVDVATTGAAVTGTLSSTGNLSTSAGNISAAAGTLSITSTAAGTLATITSTDAGAGVGPVMDLYRDSASPAASDSIGQILFNGRDSAGNKQLYAAITGVIADATSTSEDAIVTHAVTVGGASTSFLYLAALASGAANANAVALPLGQLSFPATQNPSSDANTLDDYEEGSSNPTVTSTSGTITTASAQLNYVKIGRLVTVSGTVTVTTNGTGAGALRLSSLPFANTAGSTATGSAVNNNTAVQCSTYLPSSSAVMDIYKYDGTYPITSGQSIGFVSTYIASA